MAPSNHDVARWGRRPLGERGGGGRRQWLDEWRGEGEKGGGGDARGGEEAVATQRVAKARREKGEGYREWWRGMESLGVGVVYTPRWT